METEEFQKLVEDVCKNSFPRNVVAICNALNIDVRETEELPDKISGLIYKEDNKVCDRYIILVNANHDIGRRSFTIAHELGHFILHKPKLDNGDEIISFIKTKNNSAEMPAIARCDMKEMRSNKEYITIEREANEFAASLLMPHEEFLKVCDKNECIEDVAKYFGVSIPAATVQADKVGGWFFL